MSETDDILATLPKAQFDKPETDTMELGPAQFQQDTIANNFWWLRERRMGEAENAALGALSEALYGDPRAYIGQAAAAAPDPTSGPIGPGMGRQASIDKLFADAARVRATMPGEMANFPTSYQGLKDQSLASVRRQLEEEAAEAGEIIANRSQPTVAGGLVSFAGSMAAGVSDVEGVALLPFGAGAGTLARTVLVESLLGGAGAAILLPAQQKQAEFLGTEAPDPVTTVLMGATFGAVLPIGGRVAKIGINAVTPAGRVANRDLITFGNRAKATPAERGAATALARDEASRATGPAGMRPEDNAANIDAAETALQADQPQMVRPGDVIPDMSDPRPPDAPAQDGGQSEVVPGEPPVFDYAPGGAAAPDANLVGYVTGKLIEGGMEPHVAAGFVGNFMAESGRGLNTGAVGDGGNAFGMAQWNDRAPALKRFAEDRGTDWRDVDTQIAFVFHELQGAEAGAWARIREAPDAATAARLVSELYERPGTPHLSSRMAYARMLAEQYGRGVVPKGGAPGRWRDPADDVQASGVQSFQLADLQTDANAYQYKLGGDAAGVTDRLQAERVWDAQAAIGVIVHERLDGSRFIADGHQRLGLARRLMDQGQEGVELQGFLHREADGWTVEEVRARAALKNIRAEQGTPLDAAKIMRDSPELLAQLGSRSRPFMLQAQGLAELAPGPFQAVVNKVIPQNFGAIVGRIIPDDDQLQGVAIAAVQKADPPNEVQAEAMIRAIRRMGLERRADDAQGNLFADGFDLRDTVISESARIIDRVIKDARADRALFSRLEKQADAIQEAGNVLNRTENFSRAELADRALARFQILADQPGPVRDAIDAAAHALRGGKSLDAASREVFDAFTGQLGKNPGGGAAAGSGAGGAAAAGLKPDPDNPRLPNTRGQGVQFHGSIAPITKLSSDYMGSDANFYGQGFYTSDAVSITAGYSKAKGSKEGKVYRIDEVGPVRPLDMEAPIPVWFRAGVEQNYAGFDESIEAASFGENPTNLREFYDTVRDLSPEYGYPTYEVQDIFEGFADLIKAQGFNALDHLGGLKTQKTPHLVRIYLDPGATVRLGEVKPEQPFGVKAPVRARIDPMPLEPVPNLLDLPPVGDARLEPGLFDDPIEDAAEIARLVTMERDLAARLAEPGFDLPMPRSNDPKQIAPTLRELTDDLREDADFVDALQTLCFRKGA